MPRSATPPDDPRADDAWARVTELADWATAAWTQMDPESLSFVDLTAYFHLPMLAAHLEAASALREIGPSHLPTVASSARSAYEVGVRLTWLYHDPGSANMRALAFHQQVVKWKRRMADLMPGAGIDDRRWTDAGELHQLMVRTMAARLGVDLASLKAVPPVDQMVKQVGLESQYIGYKIASEFVHAGIAAGVDLLTLRRDDKEEGTYGRGDWFLPMSLATIGGVLTVSALGESEADAALARRAQDAMNGYL